MKVCLFCDVIKMHTKFRIGDLSRAWVRNKSNNIAMITFEGNYKVLMLHYSPLLSSFLSICSYMKALKVGDKVTLEGEVMRKGRSVAYTTARIFNEKGDLAAHGTHIKHLGHS